MPANYLTQLARAAFPLELADPDQVALARLLWRTGHLHARFARRDGGECGIVEGLTPLGRKIHCCLLAGPRQGGAPVDGPRP